MPELPEIYGFARDMRNELIGRTIGPIEILQPKCLNQSPDDFTKALTGAQIRDVTSRGKWLFVELTQGYWLINLGMGGEILHTDRDHLPVKYRLLLDLDDGTTIAINYWWFGYSHFVQDLPDHPMTANLGPDFMQLTLDEFHALLRGRRGSIKSFLLNQSRIAGIGNVYVQDPLFKARVHPLRSIDTLSHEEITNLWEALRETLQESIDLGGSHWEQNLFGDHGRWDDSHFLVAYRENRPCPTCGTPVAKLRTGSTSGYICPQCQPLD